MPDSLYDADILVWSEQQATLLRRLRDGERVNDAVDWTNLIDEVETVGRSEFRACTSLIRQALLHLIKLRVRPASTAVTHWRGETRNFILQARLCATPSMPGRIEVNGLFTQACSLLRDEVDPATLALIKLAGCPFGVDDLLVEEPDLDALLGMLPKVAA